MNMFYDHLRTRNRLFTGTTALLLLASGCFTGKVFKETFYSFKAFHNTKNIHGR